MSVLEELKDNQPPVELYHYTSQLGLLGIFNTNSLWASKIHYLNDSTEFELALNLAKEVLNEKLESQGDAKERKKLDVCLIGIEGVNRYLSNSVIIWEGVIST